MDAPRNAYSLALEQEDHAWQVLHAVPRSDARYAQALADWQAAADRIGVEAEKLSKHHAQRRREGPETAIPARPPARNPRTAPAPRSG
jgi:hypothetical protein